VDEPNINPKITVENFFGGIKNYKQNKPLEDLAISGMTIKEFWQHDDKDYTKFEYGKSLFQKHVHVNLRSCRKSMSGIILHVSMC
jgi:hypothetical protein